MSRKRRGILGALGVSVIAGASALAFAPGAGAAVPSDPNPLSSNAPYLAWRGEHVRLVKCQGDLPQSDMEALRSAPSVRGGIDVNLRIDMFVEDWSGLADFKPTIAPGTADVFLTEDGICVKADAISQKAGLAMIKLSVTLDPGQDGSWIDVVKRSEVLGNHQFLAGWLSLDDPTLDSLPVGGNAAGTNTFRAGDDPANDGVLRMRVTGGLPLGNNFSELGLGPAVTLPDAWPDLARALASDRNPDNGAPSWRWDIHDDTTTAEGHWGGGGCIGVLPSSDAVDNCAGGNVFSRYFDADGPGPLSPIGLGLTINDTIGPFDPQRPDETLLGDGHLNADDAPMPAARIDVKIDPNTGGADVSGLGSLHKSDKAGFFSRDRLPAANEGSGSTAAHNLYAPYSSAYIPATGDGSFLYHGTPVSGTDGPAQGNDFPGFLVGDGNGGEGDGLDYDNVYDYWDIAHVFRSAQGTSTTCLNRDDRDPVYRQAPRGAQEVAVYTDEHGMAQVRYRPGTGAFYDALPVVKNSNGGCDLKGIDTLGTSVIRATARYPYQPTTDITPKVSNDVRMTVKSLFAKFVTEFPKGQGADNSAVRILVAHAQDVDGSPYAGETVCFRLTDYASLKPYVYDGINQRFYGSYDLAGSTLVSQSDNVVCMKTNDRGNAAVEVIKSTKSVVDVTTEFTNERLFRPYHVDFGGPAPEPIPDPSPNPLPTPAPNGIPGDVAHSVPGPSVNGNGSVSPGQQALTQQAVDSVLAAAGTPAASPRAVSAKLAKLRFAHLRTNARGKRSLVVRLDGTGKAKVRVKLFDRKGKARYKKVRSLPTNRTVRVGGLTISKSIVRASLKVIG